MNITPSMMYWLTRLDCFRVALEVIIVLLIITTAIFAIAGAVLRCDDDDDDDDSTGRKLHRYAIAFSICSFMMIIAFSFIPTTKEMAAILVVPKIANSEKVQVVGNRLYDLAVEWMDELRPKKESAKTQKQKGESK